MIPQDLIQTNFTAGEISPRAYGRPDLSRYNNAVELMENFLPFPQGGFIARSGTRFADEVKDSNVFTRLIPFKFNAGQGMALEFGNYYVRFYSNGGLVRVGGVPYELATPYATGDLRGLNITQSGDVIYLWHVKYAPRKLQRYGNTNWVLTQVNFIDGPYMEENGTGTALWSNGSAGTVTVTANGTYGINGGAGFQAGDVGRHLRIRSEGSSGSTATGWISNVQFGSPIVITSNNHNLATGTVIKIANVTGTPNDDYVNGVWQVTVWDANRFALDTSSYGGGSYAQTVQGAKWEVTILSGWTKIVSVNSPTSVNVQVYDKIPTKATTKWRLGAWSSTTGWPSVGTLFQQRLVAAATNAQPQGMWLSKSGYFESFAPTDTDLTVNSDNGISYAIPSTEVNGVRWLQGISMLMIGTAGGEFECSGSNERSAITPSNVNVVQRTYYGSAAVPSVRARSCVLSLQRGGEKLLETAYNPQMYSYYTQDISLLGEHLLNGGITDCCYQQNPDSIWWGVRNDGLLAGMTYEKDQNVIGWHRVSLGGGGFVESICTVPTADETYDQIYLIVRRTINNKTKRYVEYMERNFEPSSPQDKANMYFVDCGLSLYGSTEINSVSGLNHLEGCTVDVVADGVVWPQAVVKNGSVTLQKAAKVIHIGLHYESKFKSLRLDGSGRKGTGQGKIKRPHRLTLRVQDSLGFYYGSDYMDLREQVFLKTNSQMDKSADLFSGDCEVKLDNPYDRNGQFWIIRRNPYPLTILAMMPDNVLYEG